MPFTLLLVHLNLHNIFHYQEKSPQIHIFIIENLAWLTIVNTKVFSHYICFSCPSNFILSSSFLSPSYSPGAARFWICAGIWTLASEARVSRPPFPMRSQSRAMCFLRRVVSWGRPSTGPPACAREVAWSLGLRDKQLRRRWETAASQLSSQPWWNRRKI